MESAISKLSLFKHLKLKDLREIQYGLGISFRKCRSKNIKTSQEILLKTFNLTECKSTPGNPNVYNELQEDHDNVLHVPYQLPIGSLIIFL